MSNIALFIHEMTSTPNIAKLLFARERQFAPRHHQTRYRGTLVLSRNNPIARRNIKRLMFYLLVRVIALFVKW